MWATGQIWGTGPRVGKEPTLDHQPPAVWKDEGKIKNPALTNRRLGVMG